MLRQPLLLHLVKSDGRLKSIVKDYPDLEVLPSPPPREYSKIYIVKVIMHQIVLEIIQPDTLQDRQTDLPELQHPSEPSLSQPP